MTKPLNSDLKAIKAINRALNELDLPAQRRVLNWVIAFRLQLFGYDLPPISERVPHSAGPEGSA